MSDLELYEDANLTKPFSICDFITVEVGRSKSRECFIVNKSLFIISEIKEMTKDKDIIIANLPTQLNPKEVRSLIITFKPSLNRRERLSDNILISGKLMVN